MRHTAFCVLGSGGVLRALLAIGAFLITLFLPTLWLKKKTQSKRFSQTSKILKIQSPFHVVN
jgi:hypothetical protein